MPMGNGGANMDTEQRSIMKTLTQIPCPVCGKKYGVYRFLGVANFFIACTKCSLLYEEIPARNIKEGCEHIRIGKRPALMAGAKSKAYETKGAYIIEHPAGGTYHCSECREEITFNQ